MKIYEFRSRLWLLNATYSVEEIEVEEKPKTYVSKWRRINKDSVGEIDRFGTMILTENNPRIYLEKLLEEQHKKIENLKKEQDKVNQYIRKIEKALKED